MNLDPTRRFSERASAYADHRPGYPAAVVEWIAAEAGLAAGARVVDLGSGTGLLSTAFLDAGYSVAAVEPNSPMRVAAERTLGRRPGFESVDGRAEATTLPAASADLAVAGQAFHWFDPVACRDECLRILRGHAPVALVWNLRRTGSPFMDGYDRLLRMYCPGYKGAPDRHVDSAAIERFFDGNPHRRREAANNQRLDFDGLRGRVMSSSYAPLPGTKGHDELMAGLAALFDANAARGQVVIEYATVAFLGTLRHG